jgi:hypothetical protein
MIDVKKKSYKLCKSRFHQKYPGVHGPGPSVIFELVRKFVQLGLGNLKDKVYSNNPNTRDELTQSIRETITSTKISQLKVVQNNLFKRLEACFFKFMFKSRRETF